MLNLRRLSAILFLFLLLSHCASPPARSPDLPQVAVRDENPTIASLVRQANTATRPAAEGYRLDAAELLLAQGDTREAAAQLALIDRADSLPEALRWRLALTQAQLALAEGDGDSALRWLEGALIASVPSPAAEWVTARWGWLGEARLIAGDAPGAVDALSRYLGDGTVTDVRRRDLLWQTLESLDETQLTTLATRADTYELRGWVELGRQMRDQQASIESQLDSLRRWQSIWTRHVGAASLPSALQSLETIWNARPRQIALLLSLGDPVGRAVQEGFFSAYYAALADGQEVPRIRLYDTSPLLSANAEGSITGLYQSAVDDGADLVIGPLDKGLVRQLHQAAELPVPTLALNYSDLPGLAPANLYQFGLAPEDEILQAAQLAWSAGHRNAALLTPAGSDYDRLADTFISAWRALGGTVVSRASYGSDTEYVGVIKQLLAIDASENRAARISNLLPRSRIQFTPRRRQDVDFIYLIANPRQGRQIKPTLSFYFAGSIPVYALSSINEGLENPREDQDLDGIVFTDTPWVLREEDPLKQQVVATLRLTQGPLQRLRALGIDSFRLHPRLAQLASGQLSAFHGATGILTMLPSGRIQRQLDAGQFVDGVVRPLTAPALAINSP